MKEHNFKVGDLVYYRGSCSGQKNYAVVKKISTKQPGYGTILWGNFYYDKEKAKNNQEEGRLGFMSVKDCFLEVEVIKEWRDIL